MAKPSSVNQPSATKQRKVTYNRTDPNALTVGPGWLVKVLALTVLAASVCAYLAMCFLFWQGAWQLVLHPTHQAGGSGLPTELVHFGPDGSGTPQMVGEFYAAGPKPESYSTVLYLRPGDGQLDAADAPAMLMLHDLGLNVFAFDYRGYGRSVSKPHPSETGMNADAIAAWQYLTGLRRIAPEHILLYGAGVGGPVAVQLATLHPNAAGIVLRNAAADVEGTVRREPRSHLFPIAFLLRDRFPMTGLKSSTLPKLLMDVAPANQGPEDRARIEAYRGAADPKSIVEMSKPDPAVEGEAMKRFFDERVKLLPAPLDPALR